jgi:uncharacterized protein with PIN domain
MKHAFLRFYAELNDFLEPSSRGRTIEHVFHGTPAIKDVIESLGVPHGEVELILVDGASVGFEYRLANDERVSVYPMFEALELGGLRKLRPEPLRDPSFVLDGHLGRLAPRLRMLGFDVWWRPDVGDAELARRSSAEHRILLTRDLGLLKRGEVTHGAFIRSTRPQEQLREVVDRFDLRALFRPFTRCLVCNGRLREATVNEIGQRVPDGVRERHTVFRACEACGRVYWRGTHQERMEAEIAALG